MKQIIQKIGKAKFKLSWQNVRNSQMVLDFMPLINTFNLEGYYLLLHWQAKPFGYRRWGVYSSASDEYISFNYDELIVDNKVSLQTLQIDEKRWNTKPTSVILIPDGYLQRRQNQLTVLTGKQ